VLLGLVAPYLGWTSNGLIQMESAGSSYYNGLEVSLTKRFSRGLQYELRKTNVSVTVVYPGSTDTNFAEAAKVSPKAIKMAQTFTMSADKVAEASLNAMFSRKTESTIGMINKVGKFLVWLMPKKISEKAASNIYEV
jgi:hypothetical protein